MRTVWAANSLASGYADGATLVQELKGLFWRGSREAVEEANGGRHSHLGKRAQPALRQPVRRSCAVAWSGTGRGNGGHTYAESGRAPATIFSRSLPPCFPGFAEPGGEAKHGPEGPF